MGERLIVGRPAVREQEKINNVWLPFIVYEIVSSTSSRMRVVSQKSSSI